jgi:phosphomannomutase/phosphoglucomutase
MTIDPGIFRAYDVRGKVGPQITPEVAELLGKGFGTYIAEHEGGHDIAVGRDNRASGEELKGALMRGLLSTGATIYDVGMTTSPALYYAVGYWGLPGGVNVTGSHNPPDENGFKLVGKGNRPIAGDEVQAVRALIERGVFREGKGRVIEREIRPEYFVHLRDASRLTRQFRVAVDTGNGVAGLYAPPLLEQIGCEVERIHTELDSTYPNHLPDPQMPENVVCLQKKVLETKAHIGLAFDGDGDRLGVIDELGERHEADLVLMLLARALLKEKPGSKIVVDIKTSQPVLDDIRAHGGEPIVWRTGHSFIKLKMREDGVPLAGEQSGHMFYQENFYSDDALFAACKLLTFLSESNMPLSKHFEGIERWYTSPEYRVPCADDKKWDVVEAVAKQLRAKYPSVEIDGIRATFPDGWALVRASNTGPNLTLRFEAKSQQGLDAISAEMLGLLRKHVDVPETPTVAH